MEISTVFKNLTPRYHAGPEVEIGRVGAIVDDLRRPHGCCRLEIVGADTLSAIKHMAGVHAQLRQVHRSGMAYRGIRQTGDIGDVLSLRGKRHGHIGLAATILAGKRIALCQS